MVEILNPPPLKKELKIQFPMSPTKRKSVPVTTYVFHYTNRTAPLQLPFLLAGELASPAAEF